ncbi:formate--phosphoribosylaminoimidazolecarboxamide ligase family protein [Candidatus Micrarchaeota archaeon]|nr:formate--phosphoribosylaminoimidazolecarboxamide ligase family protein [Candidatus Micrarchaeota archaeon]
MEHTIATIGSHSALDVCEGAKAEGFKTLVACQKGRDSTYSSYYKTRKRGEQEIGVVDEVLMLDKFSEMANEKNQKLMLDRKCVFVPNRSFAVYVGYDAIEKKFSVPVFGNKRLLRAEERNVEKDQYYLMKKAGIRFPKLIKSPDRIDTLCIVKVSEAKRSYERAFFLARSSEEYVEKSEALLREGKITKEGLRNAKIEEYVIGAYFNFNFFYSPLHDEVELLGIDTRRQTNLDGFLRLPADKQLELLRHTQPSTIETGHIACTIRESLLQQALEAGDALAEAAKKEYAPGLIGPFALQGAIEERDGEHFVCFDVSLRIPGSPGTRFTPYSEYLFRKSVSFGRRIAIEIKEAEKKNRMDDVTT